eukprot:scaffold1610_cov257-Pinguiococcus_pyrenoidosus.AAC.55
MHLDEQEPRIRRLAHHPLPRTRALERPQAVNTKAVDPADHLPRLGQDAGVGILHREDVEATLRQLRPRAVDHGQRRHVVSLGEVAHARLRAHHQVLHDVEDEQLEGHPGQQVGARQIQHRVVVASGR